MFRDLNGGIPAPELKNLRKIISVLEAAGHEAWLVGGCVRDLLLQKTPPEFDITTDARPEQVQALFHKTIPTGLRHGTVTILLKGGAYEVTTYRSESGYSDGRHPDQVVFEKDLRADISRRDFTINGLAYHPETKEIRDYFGGLADLEKKIIRAIGDPVARFSEDGLRAVRACRFRCVLEFDMEASTWRAIGSTLDVSARVAVERFYDEWRKSFRSPAPEQFIELLGRAGLWPVFVWRGGSPPPPEMEIVFSPGDAKVYDVKKDSNKPPTFFLKALKAGWGSLRSEMTGSFPKEKPPETWAGLITPGPVTDPKNDRPDWFKALADARESENLFYESECFFYYLARLLLVVEGEVTGSSDPEQNWRQVWQIWLRAQKRPREIIDRVLFFLTADELTRKRPPGKAPDKSSDWTSGRRYLAGILEGEKGGRFTQLPAWLRSQWILGAKDFPGGEKINSLNRNQIRSLVEILSGPSPLTPGELAIGGNDLKRELGWQGKDIGRGLRQALDLVLADPARNSKERLLDLLRNSNPPE